jgi:hypothetical protein
MAFLGPLASYSSWGRTQRRCCRHSLCDAGARCVNDVRGEWIAGACDTRDPRHGVGPSELMVDGGVTNGNRGGP